MKFGEIILRIMKFIRKYYGLIEQKTELSGYNDILYLEEKC